MNTATNWNPADVPTKTATFCTSSQTVIAFSSNSSATVDSIAFAAGAPSYTFTFNSPSPTTLALTIAGEGISNDSANTQRFVVTSSAITAITSKQPQLKFTNSATAGGVIVTAQPKPTA